MESGLTARWMGTVPAVVFGGIMCGVVVGVTWLVAPSLTRFNIQQAEHGEPDAATSTG
jgi:hypothetical protein